MRRWPSQVLPLTDEIKEKIGLARQVSGKQTLRDRVRETNTPRSQIELGERKVVRVEPGCFGSEFNVSKAVCLKSNEAADSRDMLAQGMSVPRKGQVKLSKHTKVE
ncbi:unnamed protein product [Pleuronectes platessa]|uniref:Uncharacterized protein n=1 Tax=Pleuronectes platessa TaxID=8262 RepID=A0A9N7UES0_PLEPL|nr:unnamed protein product [Pleuronectes platessa]